MKSIPYHAKYYAHCLTLRHPSDSVQKLTTALGDARVVLNPHQVEAALFAFQSPLKKGAILADEVGLGKTIEAGLVIAQKRAEKSRRILIICPANLREQWAMEMQDKFFLPSIIFENDAFKGKSKLHNPFQRQETIVICSFQFARAKEDMLAWVGWDLAVIDDYAFGDYRSYKVEYSQLDNDTAFSSLKASFAPICKRTLRKSARIRYFRNN